VYQAIRALIKRLEQKEQKDSASDVPAREDAAPVIMGKPEDEEQIRKLNECVQTQKDEIARLLITIDEMRERIEGLGKIAEPNDAAAVHRAVKKVGLGEIMESGPAPKLKGVFERLYQDAVQRIQRLGLIHDRMLVANQAYSHIVNALVSKGEGCIPEDIPDLDRLSSTAAATLSGMWYHSETLFRRVCDYAVSQGIESSLTKNQLLTLTEMMEAAQSEEDAPCKSVGDDPNSPDFKQRRRAGTRDRVPGRRSDRNREYPGSTIGSDTGRAFWHPLPGGLSDAKSPRGLRRDKLTDPEPSTFASYITALREARGDLRADEWPRCPLPERRITKGDGIEFCPKTLKASISGSRSLPILPKGRGGILQQVNANPNTRGETPPGELGRSM
jgi:hypothetical protein